jgi:hypothetical protein
MPLTGTSPPHALALPFGRFTQIPIGCSFATASANRLRRPSRAAALVPIVAIATSKNADNTIDILSDIAFAN